MVFLSWILECHTIDGVESKMILKILEHLNLCMKVTNIPSKKIKRKTSISYQKENEKKMNERKKVSKDNIEFKTFITYKIEITSI